MPSFSEEEPPAEGAEPSFADLLESYSSKITRNIEVGNKISGRIISIGKDSVFLDTGTQIDGVANRADLLNSKGEFPYTIGDIVELYVVSVKEDEILLSKAISGSGDNLILKEAYQSAIPVNGKVIEQCKGGFHVDIHHTRAFCPVSQMDISYIENPESFIGQSFDFLILQFEERGKNIVVSRRELLKQDMENKKALFLEKLSVGSVCTCRVSRIMPYGAFVELIPGLTGLVPISEISWSHIEKPEDVLNPDDTLQVVVTAIQPRPEGDPKIALSVKQVLDNPWGNISDQFHVGDRVKGKIIRLAPFGAFVELAPGIDGLVHLSEISYTRRVNRPEDFLQTGETVYVLIKEIDLLKKRISLSIKDAEGDPWMDVPEKYKTGQVLEGILQKREKWGYIVTLEPGIVGILPLSRIRSSGQPANMESLKPGRAMTVVIDEIKPEERRITLRLDAPEDDNWQQYSPRVSPRSVGTLGDKLQQALDLAKSK
ncbi:MAG: S1 RNA-binding domain-containing protein [Deltaproteobacteria bacterium]|nr:S1 RNA-binding domain-containing protein [Deltaproteobacteria bacterium]